MAAAIELTCGKCGTTFTRGGWYAKHIKTCTGKKGAPRGRIERLESRRHPKPGRKHADRTPPAAPRPMLASPLGAPAIRVAINELRAQRQQLDTQREQLEKAIAALEALS